MKNVSESAFSSNLPVNFKVYNIIQNLRQNVNKLLTHRLRSYFIDRFEHHEVFKRYKFVLSQCIELFTAKSTTIIEDFSILKRLTAKSHMLIRSKFR